MNHLVLYLSIYFGDITSMNHLSISFEIWILKWSLSLSLSIGGPYFADSRRTGNLHGLDYDSGCHLADGNNGCCVKRHPKWGTNGQ